MIRQWYIILLLFILSSTGFAQKNWYVYRSYVTEDKEPERISIEYIENRKTGIYAHNFYFSNTNYHKTYYNKNDQVIAVVNDGDSVYYKYFKKDSAILYSIDEGNPIKDKKLIFNKKGRTIIELGYTYKTNEVATMRRYTYQDDTLKIGASGFHVQQLYDWTDTLKTDSSFTIYDDKGRVTGEYSMKGIGFDQVDSSFITEYSYQDSIETMWNYQEVNGKYVLYKRCIDVNDNKGSILYRERYKFPDKYDGKTVYTYELSKDKKYKNTKTITEHRSNGSIWKTQVFRREEVEY